MVLHQEPQDGMANSHNGRVIPRTVLLGLAAGVLGGTTMLLLSGTSIIPAFQRPHQNVSSSPLLRQTTEGKNIIPLQTRLTVLLNDEQDEFLLPRARSLKEDFDVEDEREVEEEQASERELAKNRKKKKKNKAKKKKKKTRKKPEKIYPSTKSSKSASASLAPTKSRVPSLSPSASFAPSASPTITAAPTRTPGPTTPPTSSPTKSNSPTTTPAPSLSIVEQNERVTCISIIDENNGYVPTYQWDNFRVIHPNRPMCLLRPTPTTYGALGVPAAFYTEGMNIYQEVTRNAEDISHTSDWYDICNMDESRSNGLTNVVLFVDNSGSMYTSNVQNAHDLFVQRMAAKGMTIVSGVYNGNEDYISPCNDLTLT
eukprot:Nitzschia sp. Nitz4//scaffold167_size49223//28416//29525//NITZ4_007037-RA/size49223-processed-gene-0.24-mRNA-1//1//CDS//3329538281//5273//frame0